jgi:hypothetical protein
MRGEANGRQRREFAYRSDLATAARPAMAWREDWEERFARLVEDGLPAHLALELSPGHVGEAGLWVLAVQPLADPARWAPRAAPHRYHLSLAQEGAVTVAELAAIHRDFHDRVVTLRFWERHGSVLVFAGAPWSHPAVSAAHARGWYSDRPLHLSL